MKLLLVAPSARMLAESAKRAGYDFVALDYFGDLDTCEAGECHSLNHTYSDNLDGEDRCVERLYKHIGAMDFTHLIYGSGFENRPEYIAELEKRYKVLGNSSEALRRIRNWENFFSALKKIGIAHPESCVVDRGEVKDFDGDWIVKPLNSGGGHGIFRIGEEMDFGALGEKVLLQEYVNGKAISASLISDGKDAVCLSTTEQLIGTAFNRYRYVGNIAPLDEDKDLLREIEEVSRKIVEEFELVGSVGVDMMLSNDVPYVIEVNPRVQGSMEVVEKVCGKNVVDLHIRACLHGIDIAALEEELKKMRSPRHFGRKILFADRDLKFCVEKQEVDFAKDVPHHDEAVRERDPICTVVASGKTRDECYAALVSNETDVRQRLTPI